jgi:hypothetical protein
VILKTFGWSFAVTAVALVVAVLYGGPQALALVLILGVLEVTLSFDNAVVNAKVLERMDARWQRVFLTWGILIAVFGMRLVFPQLIVGITASLSPADAIRLALEKGDPDQAGTYGFLLHQAHPQIAAFGGMFLLMLFLDWVLEDRDDRRLGFIYRPLAKVGELDRLAVAVAAGTLVLAAKFLAHHGDALTVFVAGALGLITYLVVNALGEVAETHGILARIEAEEDEDGQEHHAAGIHGTADTIERSLGGPTVLAQHAAKGGLGLFLYLEVLDATFSFDGVIGAFAITADPIIIALGLGLIGAMYVRSITIFLVRQGTLNDYVYLEHGAHWAIGALALILLVSLSVEVPEVITGGIGLVFVAAAFLSSVSRNKRSTNDGPTVPEDERERVPA